MNRPVNRSTPIEIFLAEQSGDIARQINSWLGSVKHNVRVSHFKTARQLLRRMEYNTPDLLLLETALPGFDGVTAVRSLDTKWTPVILLTTDTNEDAAVTINGLLAGASDYLVVKKRAGGFQITSGQNRFWNKVLRALNEDSSTESPAIDLLSWQQPGLFYQNGDKPAHKWVRLAQGDDNLEICGAVSCPFPDDGTWVGLAMASAASTRRMIMALHETPRRPGGGMLIQSLQGPRFVRAFGEEIARLCNHPVLEYDIREPVLTGQWRLIPGRMVISPIGECQKKWRSELIPNRFVDERRSMALQLESLKNASPGSMRIYLFDLPDRALISPIRKLISNDQIVLLHTEALQGFDNAWSGEEREASGVSTGPLSREPVSGREV